MDNFHLLTTLDPLDLLGEDAHRLMTESDCRELHPRPSERGLRLAHPLTEPIIQNRKAA